MDVSGLAAERPLTQTGPDPDRTIRQAALKLEASFLAELLKECGLGEASNSFGGGVGEDQYASLLVRHQAEEIAKSGGIGLAEMFFDALKEQQNEQG